MSQPNFYAVIPATVRYDENIAPNAKLLYGEISAMCNVEGFCWAENSYFAGLYKVSCFTISRWISQLEINNHITTFLNKKEGNSRKIYITNSAEKVLTKSATPIDEKRKTLLTKSAKPIDEKRKSIYENITINNTVNREEKILSISEFEIKESIDLALDYFIQNAPSEWESFQMRFKPKFSVKEWEKFQEIFNLKASEENLEFSTKIIKARLTRFAINYCENLENKTAGQFKTVDLGVSDNHPSRKKII